MKYTLIVFLVVFTAMGQASAQFIPQGISYQAIARELDGDELINSSLTVRVGILAGTYDGPLEWEEVHTVSTNEFGLFTLVIGQGLSTAMGSAVTFADIDWSAAAHFMKIEVDAPGSGGYEMLGISELLAVPYALHAATADSVDEVDGDVTNEAISYFGINNNLVQIIEGGTSYSIGLDELVGDASDTNELITGMVYDPTTNALGIDESGYSFSTDLTDLEDGEWDSSPGQVTNTTQSVGIGTASPTSTLHVDGSMAVAFTTLGSGTIYNATSADQYFLCQAALQPITINLPPAATCPGRLYTAKRIVLGTGDVSLMPSSGESIDGSNLPLILSLPNSEIVTVLSDGTGWWVVNYSYYNP